MSQVYLQNVLKKSVIERILMNFGNLKRKQWLIPWTLKLDIPGLENIAELH